MNSSGKRDHEDEDDAAAMDQPSDPSPTTPPPETLDYFTPSRSTRLVTIRRLQSMEAHLAKAKLESEGIRCLIADQNMSVLHPLLVGEIPVQVLEEDAERADEILRAPAKIDLDDGDVDDGYADEDWRCPRCHQKKIELVPRSPRWRSLRTGCLMLAALPFILPLVQWMLPDPKIERAIDRVRGSLGMWWVAILILLGLALLLVKRKKRCASCGHEWSRGDGSADSE